MVAATAVRGALRWAADQDLPLSSPSLWLRVAQCKAPKLKPRPIPERDLITICDHIATAPPDLEELRTRALFWLILSSGARISEALSLGRGAVDDYPIIVTQKGGHVHELVISEFARSALHDYLSARLDRTPHMFISHGHQRPLELLTKKEVQRFWDQLCRRLGVARFTSHRIRHSCATEMLRLKINHIVIAKHMGHRDLSTIQGYAEVDMDERVDAVHGLDQRFAMNVAVAV
jgi:integrase